MEYILGTIALLYSAFVLTKVCRRRVGVARWLIIEIVYNCIIKYPVGYMGLPSAFNYGSDLIMVVALFLYVYHNETCPSEERYRIPRVLWYICMLFFTACFLSMMLNIYSPVLFLWGLRNNFRFMLFAMLAAATFRKEDIFEVVDILFGYILINAIVVTYQASTMSVGFGTAYGDYVSGLFSNGTTVRGGNASLNVLICVVSTFAIVGYLEKRRSFGYMLVAVGLSLYIAAMNETKMFFLEIALIAILALIVSRKSFKTVLVAVVVIAALFGAMRVLYYFFPQFAGFFTLESILEYASSDNGYIGNGGINRLNSIPYVFENFLVDVPHRLLGVGLGNADYSSNFAFLTSAFYNTYSWTAYQWFYAPFLLIETGVIGLALFISQFVAFFRANINWNPADADEVLLRGVSFIVIILGVMMLFSNQSLRLENMGFAIQVFFCIPFVLGRESSTADARESGRALPRFRRGVVWAQR